MLAASRARLRLAQHRYAEALTLLQKVVPAYERDENPESPAVLVAKIDLAAALAGGGRGAEARALPEKIRSPVERERLPAHPACAEFARLTARASQGAIRLGRRASDRHRAAGPARRGPCAVRR